MCKRGFSRLAILFLITTVGYHLVISCEGNKQEKFDEIFRLSGIRIPMDSKILKYKDNDEFQIVFEFMLSKKGQDALLTDYNFRKIYPNKVEAAKTSSDSFIIDEIENGFLPRINIKISNRTLLYKNKGSSLVLDRDKLILYGLVAY